MLTLLFAAAALLVTLLAQPQRFDCVRAACPEIAIDGDRAATLPDGRPSPFRGFADPTIRRDPESGRLWMAYSWPHVSVPAGSRGVSRGRGARGTPAVAVHLAHSDDGGRRWQYQGALWNATAGRGPAGKAGHTSYEVANLLPVITSRGSMWYGARVAYFLPDDEGFAGRPPQSFRLQIMRAASPPALSTAAVTTLGGAASTGDWGVDLNLAALDPAVGHCSIWNEPALHFLNGELFLALSCMAFRGNTPDMARSDLVVFAAPVDGDPRRWSWRYVGRLAGRSEARELGGERLTQIELATARDGQLLAIVTPDTWDPITGDFVHHGCRVVEVASLQHPGLARDAHGRVKVRAAIIASDAGASGTAACAYDAGSTTGVVLGKRSKSGAGLGSGTGSGAMMSVTLYRTGVHP